MVDVINDDDDDNDGGYYDLSVCRRCALFTVFTLAQLTPLTHTPTLTRMEWTYFIIYESDALLPIFPFCFSFCFLNGRNSVLM